MKLLDLQRQLVSVRMDIIVQLVKQPPDPKLLSALLATCVSLARLMPNSYQSQLIVLEVLTSISIDNGRVLIVQSAIIVSRVRLHRSFAKLVDIVIS